MPKRERVERYSRALGGDTVVDVEVRRANGKIVGFALNLRVHTEAGWTPVIRYDTRHGRFHIHRFWRPQDRQIEDLERPEQPTPDYTPAFTQAGRDLEENRREYREKAPACRPATSPKGG